MMKVKLLNPWLVWGIVTVALVAYFSIPLFYEDGDKSVFLTGETTHGHYQIEMQCNACHLSEFGGQEALQESCVNCHGDELKRAKDSHPKSKFTDPRNADRTAILDARFCVTCHTEHNQEVVGQMGLTLPEDYCIKCHEDIEEDRVSHKDLGFETCATSGCHNYHDNKGIYEDFLLKHVDEPIVHSPAKSKPLKGRRQQGDVLTLQDIDAPESLKYEQLIHADWLETTHAQQGVNCSDCHQVKDKATNIATWITKPDHKVCSDCHKEEVDGFLDGKHGMRLKQNMSPMTPAMARQDMKSTAGHKELGCQSCHSAHRYDTKQAAVTACQNCHDDDHTNAYEDSPHYSLWVKASTGQIDSREGVSCASCHMPREIRKNNVGEETIVVQHNQNDNLRPNEKMIRSVCMDCHGLEFSIDALADAELVKRNFKGKPSKHIQSMDWARSRVETK